jgi:hypothetical protein
MQSCLTCVTAPAGSSTFEQARSDANGRNPDADMGTKPNVPSNAAAVGVGASYAVYQEAQHAFLYPALDAVQREIGGIVQTVARERDLT